MLFEDLRKYLLLQGTFAFGARSIKSIFDVGCSAGYLLRFMETELFPGATTLEGNDIDEYALANGRGLPSGACIEDHAWSVQTWQILTASWVNGSSI